MGNGEYTGNTRGNMCYESTPNGTNGVAGPDCIHSGGSGVCAESKTSGDKICGPIAGEFYFFVQNGWLRISQTIKKPFYRIGEAFSDMFENQIIRAVLFAAVICCLIALFIEIGYASALHEYGITPENTPIGGR